MTDEIENPPWSTDPDPRVDRMLARVQSQEDRLAPFIKPKAGEPYADKGLTKSARMAEWLVAWAQDDARFTEKIGWLYWDGQRWARDENAGRVSEMLRQCAVRATLLAETLTSEAQMLEDQETAAKAAGGTPDPNKMAEIDGKRARAKGLMAMVTSTHTAGGFDGALKLASTRLNILVRKTDWDPDDWLLNTGSGTLDLRTWVHEEPRPADRITKLTRASWEPTATPLRPVFDKFIAQVLPDPTVRSYVQQALGQALVGRVTEHLLLVFYGEGRNGKGVLLRAVRKALGDYAIEISPEIILQQRTPRHETELMDLMGTRLAIMQETSEHRVLDAGKVKALTGGDAIRAQWMHKDKQEFDPAHTLVLATNSKPRVGEGDAGTWRRLKLIPFSVNITAEQEDNTLDEKLEHEAEGVMAWLLEGLAAYQRAGQVLVEPQVVIDATREYQAESNPFNDFLEDTVDRVAGERVTPAQILSRWTTWAKIHGEGLRVNHRTLKGHMVRAGFTQMASTGTKYWEGLRFKEASWASMVDE